MLKKIFFCSFLVLTNLIGYSQQYGSFTDTRDGKIYKTIKIRNQVWLAENFAYKPSSGNFWAFDNNNNFIEKAGYLYDMETAKKNCPQGWHLPTKLDWEELYDNWGYYYAFDSLSKTSFTYNFAGWRDTQGVFGYLGSEAKFWSSTESDKNSSWSFELSDLSKKARLKLGDKKYGYSVRLIKDRQLYYQQDDFKDERDGKVYKTIKIGQQIWFAENLAFDSGTGCWVYENKKSYINQFGYLYDYKTAQQVCPSGWHLPSEGDWQELEIELGINNSGLISFESSRGEPFGAKLKNTTVWAVTSISPADNSSGFAALPGGMRTTNWEFGFLRSRGYWWSATLNKTNSAWGRNLSNSDNGIHRDSYDLTYGFSVRCVRDK